MVFSDGTFAVRTGDLRRFNTHRGRDRETDDSTAGVETLVLGNLDGDYDIDLHPETGPGTKATLVAVVSTGTSPFTIGQSGMGGGDALGGGDADIPIFTGRSEGGQESFPKTVDEVVTWTVVDDFKRLNRDKRNSGFAADEFTGARINKVLDEATPVWLASERDIDAGVRTVESAGSISSEGPDRLSYINKVARSEDGRFFIAGDGRATFRDSAYVSALDTMPFGDVDGEQRYRDIITEPDDRAIRNAIIVTSTGLADQTAEDLDSQARYGRNDFTWSTMLSTTAEMDELADDVLARYAEPVRRVVALDIGTSDTNWYTVLSKDIGDRVVVRRRPAYGGTKEQECVIEGISIESGVLTPTGKVELKLRWTLSKRSPGTLNLLTPNQSGIETDATGWATEANCTIARVTTPRLTGAACLAIDVTAVTAALKTTPHTTVPVVVGRSYKARAWMWANYAYCTAHVEISWRDSGGAELSTTTGTDRGVWYFLPWQVLTVTGTAPASAAYAVVRIEIVDITQADRWYLDAVSLREA